MPEQLRLYTFTNPTYMSQIQCGIQSLHVLGRLHKKYRNCDTDERVERLLLFDYNDNHETVIVLNGGVHGDLVAINEYMKTEMPQLELPFAHMNEDAYSLNSSMTCVGVVVPESLYGAMDYTAASVWDADAPRPNAGPTSHFYFPHASGNVSVYSEESAEWRFIKLLKSKRLA